MKLKLTVLLAVACSGLLAGCGQGRFKEASTATLAEWEQRESSRKEGFEAGVKWFARQVASSNVYLAPLTITNDNVTVSNCVFIQLETGMIVINNASGVTISDTHFNAAPGLSGIRMDTTATNAIPEYR